VKKELVNLKGKSKIHERSVRSLLKNIIGRCWPGRLRQGDVKKELANHKGKIKVHEGSVTNLLKNMIGQCWPGRLSQGDLKKKLATRKAKSKFVWGVGEEPLQKHDRPMLVGKAKPRGCEKRASEPKGEK
jgi:hypothetical protein